METINYESRAYTTVNSYIGAEGNDGKEWFDGLKFDEVYLNYDESVYSNMEEYDKIVHSILDSVLDTFDSAVSRVTDEIDRRYELLMEIDSNGTSRDGAVPMFYDTVEEKVVTLGEITDIVESMLPDTVPATAYINPSYSWENGWEYDKKEITIPIDYNVSMEFEKAFYDIKREADELIAKSGGSGNEFRDVTDTLLRQDMEKDISFEDLSNKIQFADRHEYGYELFLDNSAGKEFIDALGSRVAKTGMWVEDISNTYPNDDLTFSEALNNEVCSVSRFDTQVHISVELGDSTDVRAEMVAVDNEGNSVTAEIPLRPTEKEAIINEIAASKESERKVSEKQEKDKQPKQKKQKDDYER